ncbi:hypothetical protein CANCADRAFT_56068 [Tortispora caseinolytica NRRL Y-17796]|uniref:Uncharacterized protein n=1 Tax=Tortispora caseinolytica NRRL Y-17796 TaxID=767744 RepID=A0A1E4TKW1_9ASCO|nr:hypothetical protein CANCADRAFT_56068 [Tortispora caseinolytica NRRL Y-17796]
MHWTIFGLPNQILAPKRNHYDYYRPPPFADLSTPIFSGSFRRAVILGQQKHSIGCPTDKIAHGGRVQGMADRILTSCTNLDGVSGFHVAPLPDEVLLQCVARSVSAVLDEPWELIAVSLSNFSYDKSSPKSSTDWCSSLAASYESISDRSQRSPRFDPLIQCRSKSVHNCSQAFTCSSCAASVLQDIKSMTHQTFETANDPLADTLEEIKWAHRSRLRILRKIVQKMEKREEDKQRSRDNQQPDGEHSENAASIQGRLSIEDLVHRPDHYKSVYKESLLPNGDILLRQTVKRISDVFMRATDVYGALVPYDIPALSLYSSGDASESLFSKYYCEPKGQEVVFDGVSYSMQTVPQSPLLFYKPHVAQPEYSHRVCPDFATVASSHQYEAHFCQYQHDRRTSLPDTSDEFAERQGPEGSYDKINTDHTYDDNSTKDQLRLHNGNVAACEVWYHKTVLTKAAAENTSRSIE